MTQEVGQQLVPCFCEHALRMELHPLQMGVVAMAQPHDRSILEPGGDFKALRKRVSFSNQAVIPGRSKGLGESGEDACTAMLNRGCFPVHQFTGSDNASAVGLCERLMSEADAKGWDGGGELA